MPETLHYFTAEPETLPHSELGSISLSLFGLWVTCTVIGCAGFVFDGSIRQMPWDAIGWVFLFAGSVMLLAPLGFLAAVLGFFERDCRRTRCVMGLWSNGSGVTLLLLVAVKAILS